MSIKVLVVDDSALVCRTFAQALSAQKDISVPCTAADGRLALAQIEREPPDLIVLDVDMPEMDGLETLKAVRKLHPKLPVIMFSSLTERGATTTFQALTLGATDYLTKPDGTNDGTGDINRVAAELAAKIRALVPAPRRTDKPAPVEAAPPRAPAATPPPPRKAKRRGQPVELVVIGISTGGPTALAEFLPTLPGDFPVPILIAQHMPPIFSKQMARHLDADCALQVREAEQGTKPQPGEVWIAPGDFHMYVDARLSGTTLRLDQAPKVHGCRPAADLLFRSASEGIGAGTLAVVMTGMGRDGTAGAKLVADTGGGVLAQDEATSVVWGMPGSVVEAGIADAVLPLHDIAPTLIRMTHTARVGGASR
ncbi:MAG TPA: chemotaxis response regulator protein-glutamate methylesterase [bacterium]|nr:chemotaxis response regulator protein-glutamate methylesterase [bacterium]